jgi:hypothetical protein
MYDLYTSPGDVFRSPYDSKVEGLFDGHHTAGQIVSELPATSKDLFTEDFLNKIRKPDGVLKDKLRPMDNTCDWRPNVPVEIFHGRGDKDVDFSHTAHCADQLTRNGAAHRLTDVGDHDHNGSVRQALPRIVRFFDESAKIG